jgi:hypothetical protein
VRRPSLRPRLYCGHGTGSRVARDVTGRGSSPRHSGVAKQSVLTKERPFVAGDESEDGEGLIPSGEKVGHGEVDRDRLAARRGIGVVVMARTTMRRVPIDR